MKYFIPFAFLIVLVYRCSAPSEKVSSGNNTIEFQDTLTPLGSETAEVVDVTIVLPERMISQEKYVLGEADGDLDGDGVPEKVVVFSRDLEWDSPTPRDLIIYRQENGQWTEWIEEDNVILRADEGGMRGDPFTGIEIKKGVLEIRHYGGSRLRWGSTDRFRFQAGTFYLIGHTSECGTHCEYWGGIDYNLSTGKVVYTYEPDICEDTETEFDYGEESEEIFYHKMKKLPTLEDYRDYEYTFESPEGSTFYL